MKPDLNYIVFYYCRVLVPAVDGHSEARLPVLLLSSISPFYSDETTCHRRYYLRSDDYHHCPFSHCLLLQARVSRVERAWWGYMLGSYHLALPFRVSKRLHGSLCPHLTDEAPIRPTNDRSPKVPPHNCVRTWNIVSTHLTHYPQLTQSILGN